MIGVTGVGGQLGRLTVQHLLARIDAAEFVALSSAPEKVADLPVRTRLADFSDPASLTRAFDGLEKLLVISLPPVSNRTELHTNAIDAAAKAGVEHLFYTSFSRAGEAGNPVMIIPEHRETEQFIARSGLPSTVLRFNMWPEMLFTIGIAARAFKRGVLLSNSGKGGVAYITKDDSAAVAAAALTGEIKPGQLLEVSGPSAVDDEELAAILSEVSGRPVRYEAADDDTILVTLLEDGVPDKLAHALVANGTARRDGWYEVTTHAVERLTGRAPTTLTEFLSGHRETLATL